MRRILVILTLLALATQPLLATAQDPSGPQGGTAPPPGGDPQPPPDGGSAPPPGDGSAPPPGDGSAPPPGDGSAPPPGDRSAPPPGDGSAPPPGDGSAPPPDDGHHDHRDDDKPPEDGTHDHHDGENRPPGDEPPPGDHPPPGDGNPPPGNGTHPPPHNPPHPPGNDSAAHPPDGSHPPPCPDGTKCPPPHKECPPGERCDPGLATCEAGKPCNPPPHRDAPCEPGKPCDPPPHGDAPCDGDMCKHAPPPCSPERPCAPPSSPLCSDNADGSQTCKPPSECEGKVGEHPCVPPSFCDAQDDGTFVCREPAHTTGHADGPPGPDGGGGPPAPPCEPSADGSLKCAAPSGCGSAHFGGLGASGCAPPDFCKAADDGTYRCEPPKECREVDGEKRCFEPGQGAACANAQADVKAQGRFTPCAPPPKAFCPAAPDGTRPADGCAPPAPAPRFCADGEDAHTDGATDEGKKRRAVACIPKPAVKDGTYVRPRDHHGADCVDPPPGSEWPPVQAAPPGKVWCPPEHFAPPPPESDGFDAWQSFMKEKVPDHSKQFIDMAKRWSAHNDSAREELHKEGSARGLFAPPAFDGRAMDGSFVDLTMDEHDLGVKDFSFAGVPLLKGAKPGSRDNRSMSTTAGASLVASGANQQVAAHNNGVGLLAYRAHDEAFDVEFELEDGFEVEESDGGVTVVRNGAWRGVLVTPGAHGADGASGPSGPTNGSTKLTARVAPGSGAFFMAVPPGGVEENTRLPMAKAVAAGHLGAELSLVARNGSVAEDVVDFHGVSMRVDEATPTGLKVIVDSEKEDGKSVVITLDRDTLPVALADLDVTFDGLSLKEAAAIDAVLGPNGAGTFFVEANATTLRIIVGVEHFSEHTIGVQERSQPAPSETGGASGDTDGDAGDANEQDDASEPADPSPAAPEPTEEPKKTPAPTLLMALGVLAVAAFARRRR